MQGFLAVNGPWRGSLQYISRFIYRPSAVISALAGKSIILFAMTYLQHYRIFCSRRLILPTYLLYLILDFFFKVPASLKALLHAAAHSAHTFLFHFAGHHFSLIWAFHFSLDIIGITSIFMPNYIFDYIGCQLISLFLESDILGFIFSMNT